MEKRNPNNRKDVNNEIEDIIKQEHTVKRERVVLFDETEEKNQEVTPQEDNLQESESDSTKQTGPRHALPGKALQDNGVKGKHAIQMDEPESEEKMDQPLESKPEKREEQTDQPVEETIDTEDETPSDQPEQDVVRMVPSSSLPYEDSIKSVSKKTANAKKSSIGKKILIGFVVLFVLVDIGVMIHLMTASNPSQPKEESKQTETAKKDTTKPEFIDFKDHLVVDLNVENNDLSNYFLAVDDGKLAKVSVEGSVDSTKEGNYNITVTATDSAGNKVQKQAVVQIASADTVVQQNIQYSCLIDGSVPLSSQTKNQVDANVITFNYEEQSQTLKDALSKYKVDTSKMHSGTSFVPEQ